MGKGRPLTEFEKNLREEIFKRDNHIENSVKYAIDRGDDYGVLKNTPQWRRDAIEKYKNEHKTSVFDDDGNEVGKISYEARRAIRKNKISDYKPQNDDEKKVFDYLKNRRAESEKSASELKKKTSNELFSLKNNKNRLGGIKPDVVNLHDGAAVKNEYSRTESEAKKYKPDDNEIFEISVSPSRTVKLKYGIKNKIDDIAGENGIASDLKAKRIDEAIEKLNLSESELSDARSYAGIKKLEIATASNGKNSFIKEISQPIVKFLMGTRDTAEGAAKFLKNGGKLNGDYSEEYANIEKYYEEHPDELGNDLFDTYKSGMSNPKGDYLRNTAVDKTLEAYNDTTKASQFIGDAGFRSAGQMMGASALAYGSGAAEAASGATALIKNAADGTKAAKVISKAASIAPKISEVGGYGNVSRAANTAIKKVNSLSVGKALKFLNPFDNPTTVIMGMNAAQDKYDALKKMGYDDDTSKKNALFSGYVSAITEKMGYDGKPESFLFNRNGKPIAGSATASKSKNAKKLIKDYLTANVSEGVEEIYNTVFERMGDYLSKVGYVDENGHLKQRKVFGNEGIFDVKDMGENFLGGFVGGAVMGSVGVLSNIASYDTKTVHEYADEVKKQVSKSNELVEKYAKESGMETVSLPDEPDWKKASVNEINNYYEKAVDAHLNILFNENVIKSDSEKLDGAEKLIATPDDSTSAYADDEQIHDASENLAEGNAGVSVQQLESGVKKLTDNLTAEYKSSYIKNIPNYQTVYDENLRLSSTPGKVVDEQFVRTYALSYAEGLRQNNSKAYKKLSAVSDDVGGMLSDYILRNKTPQGVETNEDMSALYRTAGGLKKIINRAANAVMSANNQIYGKSDTLTEAANEISRGNYSVIKYENAGDISLSKVGEYYEAYGTDAVKLKNLIPVSTHYTERNGSKTLVAAIPAGNINEYIDTLKLSANAYSAGGREFISLTPNTADTTNGSVASERKTDAYESNSNIEVSENEISVSSKPSAQQVSEIAFVISRNPSIPLILNGNEKLGETVLFYAEEEDTSRERIENDINSYYDGVMPEIGTKIPNEYDEDMKFSVDENTDGYSTKEIENWKDSKNIVVYNNEAQFKQFVDEVLDNKKPDRKMYFGKVSENAAKNIFEKTGVDVSGYNISLKGYEIRKILLNSHGNAKSESTRGQAAINVSDLLKIPEIITNPDYIGLSDKLYNGNKVIEFRKEFNGRTVVISYVSGKHHDLQIQTMYKNIKRNLSELPSEDNSLSHTSKTRLGTVSSIDNISQNDDVVNSSIRENAGNDDRLYPRQSSDDDGIKFARESNRNQQNTEVENYGRDDILNGDDRRISGKSEGERGSSVQEVTGNAKGNASEEQSGASSRRVYARDVKEAGGVERRTDRGVEADFVKPEYYNDEMRRIAAENDERGVVTHFILGNGRAIKYGTNFRGAVRGNEVYIQADHGKYSPSQINRHEIIHRNYSTNTVLELKNRILSRLTNKQINDISERLYRDYAQKRRSFDEIFEEFVCDVLADMNDYAEMFSTETREYWTAEEQERKGYSPSTYRESIDAGGKTNPANAEFSNQVDSWKDGSMDKNEVFNLGNTPDENFVRKQAEAGNLIFADKNKSQQWSTSRGLQLPKLVQSIADNTNITQNDNIVNSSIRKNAGNDTRINTEDVRAIQSIPKKSVNDFTSEDIKKTENFAKKYYSEMGEKSPFFRAWFGDWRANDKSEVVVADKKGAVRGTTKNLDTGWDIQISGKVFNETKSHSSSHAKGAFPYLDYINSIVENAVLLDSYTVPSGKAKSSNSAMMHSLYAIADMENGRELVKLYVEELNDVNSDGTIKRAYQLQNITKAPAASVRVQNNILSSLTNTASADTYTVSQLFDLVKSLDKNFKPNETSKVVNEDGTPKVVYHGTDNFGFTVFDTAKSDDNSTLFFTDSKDIASTYSGKEGVTQLGDESNTKYGDTPNDIVRGLNEVRSADDEFAEQRYFYLDKDGVNKINAEIDLDAYALMKYLDNYDFSNEKENVKSTALKLDEKLNNLEYDSISTPLYMLLHHSAVFGDEKSARRFAKLEKNVRLINEIKKNRKSDVIVGEGLNGYSFYIYDLDAAKDILSKKLKMGIYSGYLNMQNPYIVDCDGKNWNDITYYEIIPDELKKFYKNGLWRHGTTREAAAYAKNEGFDGVIFENVTDNGGNNSNIENKPVNVYVAFNSNQIKSATDNIGTFDKANNDIRFSADENTDVNVSGDEDMSYLSEPVKNIKNDIREVRLRAEASHGKVFDRKDINEVCDSILNNINTGAVRGIEIKSKKDRTVMSVLVNRVLNSAGVDAKRKHTRALARFIAQNATAYDSKSLSAADGVDYESDKAVITSYIKHGVKLSPDAKEAVISVVGESSAKGYISMMSNENALGIDAVYDELRLVMPEYFTEDLLSDGDKMRRVMEVYTWLKEGRDLQEQKLIDIMDESDRREFTDILSQQLDDAFEMRGRESLLDLELVKERQRNEKKIKALEDKYRGKISELRSKAENKIKNSAEKKKIEVKQERYKFKSLSEAVSKYGRIKEGEKPYRETAVPRKIDKDRYVSRFARTMVEAGVTPNEALSEFEERILSGDMTYERITDEKAKLTAEEKIKRRGFLKSLEDWDEMILSNQRIGKNEMAFGQMLYNQCINAKDAKHAMKIAADLANIATQAGQTVQACQLLKQMSPDCQLYSLEQSVSKMEDEFRQQLKLLSGKNRDIDIKINESFAQEYLNAETQEERDIAMDKLLEDIAGQIPSSLKDKWDSWRYLSMLGNPRTHIRNIGGNLVFMLPVHLKNTLSYIAEKAIPKGQRTKSYIKTAESKEFAKQDYIKMKDIIQGNSGKFEGISKINELRRIYKFKPLEGLRKANFAALEWEDGIFLKHHYENALAQIMTARGYTAEFLNGGTSEARAALEAARAYAINEAQKATYRDANAAAEAISSAQRKLQNSKYFAGRAAGLALEGVVPFKKTPLNIVKRGIEYSPVGLINGVYDMAFNIKSGKTTAAEAIDKLASGLVGTALTVLGMWLASIGLVRGNGDDDKNAERLDNATGEQSYSVRIGKHSYTIDWVAPASMPFFVGVNIQKAFASDKKFTFEDIVKALVKIPDPIMSLSVLSSLSDLLSAGNYADTGAEKAAAYAWQTATSYVGQAYPTMFGQIARTIDKAKRNTYYADTENGIPDGLERFINRQLAKTPGASRLIEPKIDMWGREETYGDTWYGRFVGNTLSPGYYKEIDSTALDDELRRLNEEYEGDGSVLPPKILKYFTYEKQKYYMNPSEYTKYSVIRGQKSFEAADELIRTDGYKNKSAEEKKKALEKCYDAAGDEARNEILKGRGVDVAEKEAEKEQSKKKSKSKSSNKRFR